MNNESKITPQEDAQRRYDEMSHASSVIRLTMPPMVKGQTDWKLYSEYQSPIGRDAWPWHHRIIWRVLMYFHDRAERLWHWFWDVAQPFKQPEMKYEAKYHEIKVLKKDGRKLTVNRPQYVANGQPVFVERRKANRQNETVFRRASDHV